MDQLAASGQKNTQQFKQLSEEAGHLQHSVDEVNKTVKHLGSSTKVIDGLLESARGVAAGFALAQGASALFGAENKELQEVLVKVQASMEILQATQEISNLLQKDSAASLLLMRNAQVANVAATEGATIATKAWNLVLSLNPIVLVIALVASLAKVIYDYATNASEAEIATDQLNKAIERTGNAAERVKHANENESALTISKMKLRGETAQKISDEELALLKRNHAATIDQQEELKRQLKANDFANKDAKEKVNKEIARLDKELGDERYAINIKTNENIAEANKAAEEEEKKRREEAEKARRKELSEIVAIKALAAARIPDTDPFRLFEANEQLILARANLEKFEIQLKAVHKEITQAEADAAKSLVDVKATDEINKLRHKLLEASVGTDKELEKGRKDRLKDMQQTNLKVLDGTLKVNDKIVASQKDINNKQNLVDEADRAARRKKTAATVAEVAGYLNQGAQLLSTFFDQEAERQIASIERQKTKVQELQDAGEITAKQAQTRTKRLDQEEKNIQIQQAKRQKAIAIFEAITNTAAAVTQALASSAFPLNVVLASVVGALGAAQIALIASRPLPKFAGGKKRGQGFWHDETLGIIGEAGAEMHVTERGAYIADRPTLTIVKRQDTIYTAAETRRMFQDKPYLSEQFRIYSNNAMTANSNSFNIDYKRLGEEVGAHVHNTAVNLTEKGIEITSRKGLEFHKYLSARRGL